MKKIIELLKNVSYILDPAQKRLSIIYFVLSLIGSFLEILGVSAIVPLVNVIVTPERLMENKYIKNIDFISKLDYSKLVILVVVAVIVIYLIKNLYFIFLSWIKVKFSCKVQRELTVKTMNSLFSRGYQFFLNINAGQYGQYVSGDPSVIYGTLNTIFGLVSESVTALLIFVFLFITDWQLSVAIIILALVCLVLLFRIYRYRVYSASMIMREFGPKASQAMSEAYYGVKDVLLLRKQQYFIYGYEKNCIKMQKAQCKQTVATSSPAYIIEGICVSGIMLCVGARVAMGNTDTAFISTLAAFAVGVFRILPSLGRLSSSFNSLMGAIPQISALKNNMSEAEAFLNDHPEMKAVINVKNASKGIINRGNHYVFEKRNNRSSEERMIDKIELRNVTFTYEKGQSPVLKDINLTIKKGQSIALIGESGAGKSTLVDIILGLLIPQTGQVLLDDVETKNDPQKWADLVGYVPQTVFLCDASVKSNVAFGEREEDIDEELVKDALRQAEMLDFVESLPDGLESRFGDRGVRLSGGQRQRIAIARALYHKPELLVLDEATSALDNNTESTIMEAINKLQGKITMVIVAHRLTTVEKCDVIYEVKDTKLIKRNKEEIFSK